MKKNLIILVAISLGFVANVNAQNTGTDKIKIGIKAGGNLMTLGKITYFGQEFDSSYKPGFTAGIFSEIPLGAKFMLVPEVNYSQKGADVEGSISGFKGKVETRINYLDVPIAVSYRIAPNFAIFAGPQVSFLLNQKTTTYLEGDKQGDNTDTKDFEKTIAGALIGLGYNFTPNINVTGRYMRDFQKGSNDKSLYGEAKNSGLSLTVGYSF